MISLDLEHKIENLRKNLANHKKVQKVAVELKSLFDELCPVYINASAEDRESIRSRFHENIGLSAGILWYASTMLPRIKSSEDQRWLGNGLAAVSIENCDYDFRDTFTTLAKLYVSAQEAGIDPEPHFQKMSKLSSREKANGTHEELSMNQILMEFHRYAVVGSERTFRKTKRWSKWFLLALIPIIGYLIFASLW